jgi:hypothetical protein
MRYHAPRMTRSISFLTCTFLLSSSAAFAKGKANPTVAEPEAPAIDLSAAKDKLQLLTDGKQHYVLVNPVGEVGTRLYYGDGKRFYQQRMHVGGLEGSREEWDSTFWEPRVPALWQAEVSLKAGRYQVLCNKTTTQLTRVEGDERAKIIDEAKFYEPLWKYRAYALARDGKGVYYYVDRPREPENSQAFRLFAGPRGNLKPLKMTNVVSDSQGDIFTTKKGELRLVLDKKRSLWVAGKTETELTPVPVEANRIMIYSDLGAYTGQRLGTPCDDMM